MKIVIQNNGDKDVKVTFASAPETIEQAGEKVTSAMTEVTIPAGKAGEINGPASIKVAELGVADASAVEPSFKNGEAAPGSTGAANVEMPKGAEHNSGV